MLGSAFSLAFALGALTTGFVVDRFGVRRVYPLMVHGWSAAGVLLRRWPPHRDAPDPASG
jgi:ACS family hexuronate transporter-like MFS transporter